MYSMVMGGLNGTQEKVAFNTENVMQIIKGSEAKIVTAEDDSGLFLELNGRLCRIRELSDTNDLKPYFILHKSGDALNISDYRFLFNVRALSDSMVTGVDDTGSEHRCRRHELDSLMGKSFETPIGNGSEQESETEAACRSELSDLQSMVGKLRNGEFYESLTMEFSGKIKAIAQELIDFRNDIRSRIEPEIVQMAARDIPEASNQLEGINQTLESSTMKIMDINEEQMELSNRQLEHVKSLISGNENGRDVSGKVLEILKGEIDALERISGLSMSMMEPLSFQDLVGQRIQKIIRLVKSMEVRIEDLIISFGIKIQKHKEDPEKSFEDLRRDVENYKSELKGPQNEGEGLDQGDIDALLANL